MLKTNRSRNQNFQDDNNAFDPRGGQGTRRRQVWRRRACKFCVDYQLKADYKNAKILAPFITERGRIIPRRISGNCAFHQRELTHEIKRARTMALLPFTATQRP